MKTSIKQVEAFEQLLGICKSQGSTFNPSRDSMTIEALESLLQTAREKTQDVYTSYKSWVLATNDRRDAFEALRNTCTRVINAASVSGMKPSLFEDIRQLNSRIQGRSSKVPLIPADEGGPPGNGKKPKGPISHLDSASKIKSFSLLIGLLETHEDYAPNESSISIDALKESLEKLKALQSLVYTTFIAYEKAKDDCYTVIHREEGMYGMSRFIKRYMKSAFGPQSVAYHSIAKLKFYSK